MPQHARNDPRIKDTHRLMVGGQGTPIEFHLWSYHVVPQHADKGESRTPID